MSSQDLGSLRVEASGDGRYNMVEIFQLDGTFNWPKPADIAPESDVLVHVWGAGGSGGSYVGGGGGGLAVKRIKVRDLLATTVITVGAGQQAKAGRGGTSSFGTHCSATGGNGGDNNSINEGSTADQGVGGMGIGGDINRRGGSGGFGTASAQYGGGGGGSAPAPYGRSDGFRGGNGAQYVSGGGGGIGGQGGDAFGSIQGNAPGGGGSMSRGLATQTQYGNRFQGGHGGNGLLGTGGLGAQLTGTGTTSTIYYGNVGAEFGRGGLHVDPNLIIFGGGGGGGGIGDNGPSIIMGGGDGGPGGGGGGLAYNTTIIAGGPAGQGGMLGGGGGGLGTLCPAGDGGNAGGGGGFQGNLSTGGYGGPGLIIIQYRLVG